MRHIAREGRCYVVGVNPCMHLDQIPADFPHRERVDAPTRTSGSNLATVSSSTRRVPSSREPARHEETILYADIDLAAVRAARRYFDPVGHYHRPDIFQLHADTRPRPSVVLQDFSAGSG